jgi:hypothetical protein
MILRLGVGSAGQANPELVAGSGIAVPSASARPTLARLWGATATAMAGAASTTVELER